MSDTTITELGRDGFDEAVDVLTEAFATYPTTAWFFERSPVARDEALAALVRFFVTARLERGEPVLGVRLGGALAAVGLVSDPSGGASPPTLDDARDALWARVGDAARARYEAYGAALAPLLQDGASRHVNLVGVRPSQRGRGLARRLLDHVHVLAGTTPDDRGVTLATEDPANLGLYRHLGYEVTGSTEVAPGITAWALRRPTDPLDVARGLASRLSGLPWAIGGSVLLRRLGIAVQPRDLDLVTTVAAFDVVAARLGDLFGPGERPGQGTAHSAGFVRWTRGAGPSVDVMAGVRAGVAEAWSWELDPASIEHADGLPWSRGVDWLEVYTQLGRHERAEQLRRHLLEWR